MVFEGEGLKTRFIADTGLGGAFYFDSLSPCPESLKDFAVICDSESIDVLNDVGIYNRYSRRGMNLENVFISNFGRGLYIAGTWVHDIIGLRLYNNYQSLVIDEYPADASANHIAFYGGYIEASRAYPLTLLKAKYVTFINFLIEGNDKRSRIYEVRGLKFLNCHFEESHDDTYMLYFQAGTNKERVTFEHCSFDLTNTVNGMYIKDTKGLTIDRCTVAKVAAAKTFALSVDASNEDLRIIRPLQINVAGKLYAGIGWREIEYSPAQIDTFDDDDLTPSVAGRHKFKTATGHGAGRNITMFDDGYDGQEIEIISSNPANATTIVDGGNLLINGNWVDGAEKTLKLLFDGTNWYEIARR